MTKTNFIALAAALKRTMPVWVKKHNADPTERTHYVGAYTQWTQDVIAVIGVLEQTNPRFRKDKFITACGIPNLLTE